MPTDLATLKQELAFYEAKAKQFQSFALELLDDFSLHVMDRDRLAQIQPPKMPTPPPKKRPAIATAAPRPAQSHTTEDNHLAQIVEECERILDNMEDWIDAASMAVKLLASGFVTDLHPADFAHAVREAFQLLCKRHNLEVQAQPGLGRLYRMRRS